MDNKLYPISGFLGYFITKHGEVYSKHKDCRGFQTGWLKGQIDKFGYRAFTLCRGKKRIRRKAHTLVLETFVSRKPIGFCCRHLDGNKLNNNLENLCWGTYKENAADALRHGVRACGERQGASKLTKDEVEFIRWVYSYGIFSQRKLAKFFGMTQTPIGCIVRNKAWKLNGGA